VCEALKYRAVAAASVLRGEMQLLEPEAEDAEPREIHYAPLSFLSHVGSNGPDWPLNLWQTFSGALGVPIPILVNHPRMLCACRKHFLGTHPDHVHCCDHASAGKYYCPSTGFECYFLLLSNCTAPKNFRDLGVSATRTVELDDLVRHRIVIVDNSRNHHHTYLSYKRVQPETFGTDREGRRIVRSSHFWMSILMRYLLRPNRLTVEQIIQPALADVFPRGLPTGLASVFIQWGDKGSEVLKLEDVYAHMAPLLAANVSHVYVGSESEDAIRQVVATYGYGSVKEERDLSNSINSNVERQAQVRKMYQGRTACEKLTMRADILRWFRRRGTARSGATARDDVHQP